VTKKLWLVREIFDSDVPVGEIDEFSQYYIMRSDGTPWLYDRPWWARKFKAGVEGEFSGWWSPDPGGVAITKQIAEELFPHLKLKPGECCQITVEEDL
jgi:hypothetical protein